MSFIDCPQCGHYDSVAAMTCPAYGADRTDLIQELSAIDLQWEHDRRQHMVRSKHGQEVVPTKTVAVVVVVLVLAVATGFVNLFSTSVPAPSAAAPAYGMIVAGLMIVSGLGIGVWYYLKSQAYEEAHAAYMRKRSETQSKYERLVSSAM